MMMSNCDRSNPRDLYRYLCEVYGSEDVVKIRRKFYFFAEIFSNFEIEQNIAGGSKADGFEFPDSDFDVMILRKNIHVYESLSDTSQSDDCTSIIMDTNDTKLGYTRLRFENEKANSTNVDNLFLTYNAVNHGNGSYISSYSVRCFGKKDGHIIHGPCLMLTGEGAEYESLICFRCKTWIPQAADWVKRTRNSSLKPQLIDDITKYGILFIPVGSKTPQSDILEWKISFSIAEKRLVHSFSHTQFLCYAMMKTILSDIIKKKHEDLLCSYFIKTTMLWLSEEKPANFWSPDNLLHCYLTCLKRFIYYVKYRICPHYFIPQVNFYEDRFSDTEHGALLTSLLRVQSQEWEALRTSETLVNFEKECKLNSCSKEQGERTTSSIVSPLPWLEIFLLPNYDKCLKCMTVLSKISESTNSTRRLLVYVLASTAYEKVSKYKPYDAVSGNKQFYKSYKSILPYILVGSKSDCISGWCQLASLFYKLKLYKRCMGIVDDCIIKCTREKGMISANSYISIPNHIADLLSSNRYCVRVIQHFFLRTITFKSSFLLPIELEQIFKDDIRTGYVHISPMVYIYFLKFLCTHHLKQYRQKELILRYLKTIVNEKYFIIGSDQHIKSAEKILKVALSMLHFTYNDIHKL